MVFAAFAGRLFLKRLLQELRQVHSYPLSYVVIFPISISQFLLPITSYKLRISVLLCDLSVFARKIRFSLSLCGESPLFRPHRLNKNLLGLFGPDSDDGFS